jgi:hypothetical protein
VIRERADTSPIWYTPAGVSRPMPPLRKILREPLLYVVVLGAGLFMLFGWGAALPACAIGPLAAFWSIERAISLL